MQPARTLCLAFAWVLVAQPALADSFRSWGITSRVGGLGGATVFTEAPDPPPEPAFDGTTGFLVSDAANIHPAIFGPGEGPPLIRTGAEGTFAVSQGFISGGSTYTAQSTPPDSTIFNGRGKATLFMREDVIVLPTAAAPAGTEVDVRMALALAFAADAIGGPAGFESGLVIVQAGAGLGNVGMSPGDNDFRKSLPNAATSTGITQTGIAELIETVVVGSPFRFQLSLLVDSQGSVQTHGVGNVNPTQSTGFALATLAFGFEALPVVSPFGAAAPAEVALIEFASGGAAPHASGVSVAAARANLPNIPRFGVPEPLLGPLCGLLVAVIATVRKRA